MPVHQDSVDELAEDLTVWRSQRSVRGRIPEHFWERAVVLSRIQGVSRVSRVASLSYLGLRKRVEGETTIGSPDHKPVPAPPDFVEWVVSPSTTIAECVMKVESASGARMQVELPSITPSHLVLIIKEFAG